MEINELPEPFFRCNADAPDCSPVAFQVTATRGEYKGPDDVVCLNHLLANVAHQASAAQGVVVHVSALSL